MGRNIQQLWSWHKSFASHCKQSDTWEQLIKEGGDVQVMKNTVNLLIPLHGKRSKNYISWIALSDRVLKYLPFRCNFSPLETQFILHTVIIYWREEKCLVSLSPLNQTKDKYFKEERLGMGMENGEKLPFATRNEWRLHWQRCKVWF